MSHVAKLRLQKYLHGTPAGWRTSSNASLLRLASLLVLETILVFWDMVNFPNTINHLATQMNDETSFKQHNKERFIIVAGVKE